MSFVSLKNGQLSIDGKSFKFLSFNIPNFAVQEDPWRQTTAFEQEDLLASLNYIKATVARPYTFSFPSIEADVSKHVIVISGYGTLNCKWILNENLMRDLDYGLFLAKKYNIKMILPLIDTYSYWGGISAFTSMFGINTNNFFTDSNIRTEWLSFVSKILLRNNSFNGLYYYEDPAILAWETINEGSPTVNWTLDTAEIIKSIDSNHLVIDGAYGLYGWDDKILQSPLIDIVSNHYYPLGFQTNSYSILDWILITLSGFFFLTILAIILILIKFPEKIPLKWKWTSKRSLDSDPIPSLSISDSEESNDSSLFIQTKIVVLKWTWILFITLVFLSFGLLIFFILFPILIKGLDFPLRIAEDCSKLNNKPLLVGEFGLVSPAIIQKTIDYIPSSCSIGGLVWSLRGHSGYGGFHTHLELGGFWSYHIPGFRVGDGFGADELQVIKMVKSASNSLFSFQNNSSNLDPLKPIFLNYTVDSEFFIKLLWKGCAGCNNYTLYGSHEIDDQWEILFSGISDNYPSGLFDYKSRLEKKYNLLKVEGWIENQSVNSTPVTLVNS